MLSLVPSMSSGCDHGLWSCLSSGNGQVMGSNPGMHVIASVVFPFWLDH